MGLVANWIIAVCLVVSTVHTMDRFLPGNILVYNWIALEDEFRGRFKYLCNSDEAFECVSEQLWSAAGTAIGWKDLRSHLGVEVRPEEVQEMFCWWPDSIPQFNQMFREKYPELAGDTTLARNYSVWDVDRIFAHYPTSVLGVRAKVVDDFLHSGPFGEYVGVNQKAMTYLAIMFGILESRTCLEKVSDMRW